MSKQLKTVLIVSAVAGAIFLGVVFINYRKKNIKRFALLFEGIKELGNNAGFSNAIFQKMMDSVGWNGGEPWCMYFAKGVYNEVFPKLSMDFGHSLRGSSQISFNNVAEGKSESLKTVTEGKPMVGDIVIWQRVDNPSKGHAGIVTKVYDGGQKFDSIEGNTNYDPSFQGEGDIVDVVPHDVKYGQPDMTYKSLKLRGFIRLK